MLNILREMTGERVVLSRKNLGIEALHGLGSERWHFHDHFVEDAACTPNVTSVVIRHVLPHLGAGVVRSTSLGAHHTSFDYSRDIHVSELNNAFLCKEHVCTLDVSVANFEIMEGFETSDDLNEEVPDLLFREGTVGLFVIVNEHQEVATVSVLHHDAQTTSLVLKESLLVANHIRVVDRGENAHLIERILLLFGTELSHLDLLHCINGVVTLALYAVNFTERSLT